MSKKKKKPPSYKRPNYESAEDKRIKALMANENAPDEEKDARIREESEKIRATWSEEKLRERSGDVTKLVEVMTYCIRESTNRWWIE
jgi:hypothetical protein